MVERGDSKESIFEMVEFLNCHPVEAELVRNKTIADFISPEDLQDDVEE